MELVNIFAKIYKYNFHNIGPNFPFNKVALMYVTDFSKSTQFYVLTVQNALKNVTSCDLSRNLDLRHWKHLAEIGFRDWVVNLETYNINGCYNLHALNK
jgi:hypothetical protein